MPFDSDLTAPRTTEEPLGQPLMDVLRRLVDEAIDARRATDTPPLLTKAGVARYLSVSIRTVDTLVAEGELVPIKIRAARRFTKDAVDRYIHSRTVRR